MSPIDPYSFDLLVLWTWFLLFVRVGGLLTTMPGISGFQAHLMIRTVLATAIAFAIVLAGVRAPMPTGLADGMLMITSELVLGLLIGEIPNLILGAAAVGGQLTTGAIGLGQASMIDPSLGQPVTALALVQSLLATLVFLMIDGHLALIRAAAGLPGGIGVGQFVLHDTTVMMLVDKFANIFELAITISAPVIVTLLLTQFVLGLLTKFVPQINVFIVSLPLTVGLGLFMILFSFPALADQLGSAFLLINDSVEVLLEPGS